jgi:2-polyprenyl-3-methyl-5-hydroxy-6-metoxy-1,4-benzoquinol methylase
MKLVQQGWIVSGIEPDLDDAALAEARGIFVHKEQLEAVLDSGVSSYSLIVLGDVLEHTVDPWSSLRLIGETLRSNARVIISLPNVAHLAVRMQLLLGRFNYSTRGLLDRTHLRFFTRKTALNLIESSGLRVHSMQVTSVPIEIIFPSLMSRPLGGFLLALNQALATLFPRLLGYQFVLVCGLGGSETPNHRE